MDIKKYTEMNKVIRDFRNEFEDLQRNHPVLHDVVDHLIFSSKNPSNIDTVFGKIWEISQLLNSRENIVPQARLESSV